MSCACTTTPPAGGSVPLEDFLPYVQPYVLGCPDELVAHAVRESAIEFCSVTLALKREVCTDIQAGVNDYCLTVADGYVAKAISALYVRNTEVRSLGRRPAHQSNLIGYYYTQPGDIILSPAPTQDGAGCLCATFVVAPGQDTCYLDRVLYDNYAEIIGDGAISRLLLIPKTDWYDRTTAGVFVGKARRATSRAKVLLTRGLSTGPSIMRAPRFI